MPLPALFFLIAAAPQSTPTGPQLLEKVQKAYDSVRTMELDSVGVTGKTKGTAHISFERPGKLRIKGQTVFGSPYEILVKANKVETLSSGNWLQGTDPSVAISTVALASANAATDVPSILLKATYGGIHVIKPYPATVKREKFMGRDTFRYSIAKPVNRTIWIDAKTYFFLRTETKFRNQVMTVDFSSYKVNQPIPANRFTR